METRAQVWRRWKRGLLFVAAIYVSTLAYGVGLLYYKSSVQLRPSGEFRH